MGPPNCEHCKKPMKCLLQRPEWYCDCLDDVFPELDALEDTSPGWPSFRLFVRFEGTD